MLISAGSGGAFGTITGGPTVLVPASAALLAKCASTARAVGYPVPCPLRVPAGLTPTIGRPGCKFDIIGPAKPCPDTVFAWRGWVVGSSETANQHLVLTASPHPIQNLAKVVNGPAWLPGEKVKVLGAIKMYGWDIREVYVPPATNDGSAFAHHVVLIWTVGQHTYAVGFHDVSTIRQTLALDLAVARTIKLIRP